MSAAWLGVTEAAEHAEAVGVITGRIGLTVTQEFSIDHRRIIADQICNASVHLGHEIVLGLQRFGLGYVVHPHGGRLGTELCSRDPY